MGILDTWNIVSYTGLEKLVLGCISPMVKASCSASPASSSSWRNILLANSMPALLVPLGSPILLEAMVTMGQQACPANQLPQMTNYLCLKGEVSLRLLVITTIR